MYVLLDGLAAAVGHFFFKPSFFPTPFLDRLQTILTVLNPKIMNKKSCRYLEVMGNT